MSLVFSLNLDASVTSLFVNYNRVVGKIVNNYKIIGNEIKSHQVHISFCFKVQYFNQISIDIELKLQNNSIENSIKVFLLKVFRNVFQNYNLFCNHW